MKDKPLQTSPATFFIDGGVYTKAAARKLATELLDFAQQHRPDRLVFDGRGPFDGSGLPYAAFIVRGNHAEQAEIVFQVGGYAVSLEPAEIDQLINWIQGHREANQ